MKITFLRTMYGRDVPNVLVIMKEYFIIQKKTNTSLKF